MILIGKHAWSYECSQSAEATFLSLIALPVFLPGGPTTHYNWFIRSLEPDTFRCCFCSTCILNGNQCSFLAEIVWLHILGCGMSAKLNRCACCSPIACTCDCGNNYWLNFTVSQSEMDHFTTCARLYKLHGLPVHELCDHNYKVRYRESLESLPIQIKHYCNNTKIMGPHPCLHCLILSACEHNSDIQKLLFSFWTVFALALQNQL